MEVQADVQKERCSLSGESATVSLGTISDNASTKAMAGSILNAYMPLERSVVTASSFYALQHDFFFLLKTLRSRLFYLFQTPCGPTIQKCFNTGFTPLCAYCLDKK